jgi:hypothetical protein
MMLRRHILVLAVYPNTRGFAFILFEGPLAPVDWAVVETRGKDKNQRCMRRIRRLLERYTPDALVLQRMGEGGTRRARRIQSLNENILALAGQLNINCFTFSRDEVHRTFSYLGIVNKQAIAGTLARHIPALERYLPPPRKIWKSEDARMGLFEAAALAWKFFQQ